MRGLILLAHGARDAAWAAPFDAVRQQLMSRHPARPVHNAYLEFMAPDLLGAGQALVAQGCHSVDILPLFLGAGGHVRKDVPALLEQLQRQHPQVHWTLHPAIGESPLLIDAMARIADGLHAASAITRENTP